MSSVQFTPGKWRAQRKVGLESKTLTSGLQLSYWKESFFLPALDTHVTTHTTISSSNIPDSKPVSAAPRAAPTNAAYNSWLHYLDQPCKDTEGNFHTLSSTPSFLFSLPTGAKATLDI